jgi:hypothetical protein
MIVVERPGRAVNFAVSKNSYPVYQKDSSFNTAKNFDDGVFVEVA